MSEALARVNGMPNLAVGRRVAELRAQRGWTQAHLSEVSGADCRTIQRLEATGRSRGCTLMAVAQAFDLNVRDLFSPAVDAEPAALAAVATAGGYQVLGTAVWNQTGEDIFIIAARRSRG